jgi:hypothetical protein
MRSPEKRTAHRILMLVSMMIVGVSAAVGSPTARAVAVEVGDRAPDFTLPSTNGVDVSLRDFRAKKWFSSSFTQPHLFPREQRTSRPGRPATSGSKPLAFKFSVSRRTIRSHSRTSPNLYSCHTLC